MAIVWCIFDGSGMSGCRDIGCEKQVYEGVVVCVRCECMSSRGGVGEQIGEVGEVV